MSEPQTRTGFDNAARESVRGALKRYMQDHRIGTPTLQYRIIEADAPRRREIPLSTLQRFITGSHHTQDHHVALCQAFVSELPYYGEGRDIAQLGEAVASFFLLRWPERDGLARQNPDRFCGRYAGATHVKNPTGGALQVFDEETAFAVPYSVLTFSRDGSESWLRVQESITNINLDYPFSQEQTQTTHTYEGVFVAFGPMMRLMLRSNLTRQPRFYELSESEPGVLLGVAREASFLAGMQDPTFGPYLECLLRPEQGPDQ